MHRYLFHNGEIRDARDLCLSPGQVGLMTGWGVFSTLLVCDGVLFAWERHWARMRQDAAKLQVPFPPESTELERGLARLIEANQAWNATLRVMVIRNRGGQWEGPSVSRDFDLIAFTANLKQWEPSVKLDVVPNARLAACEFAGVKYLSWAVNLIWYERARSRGLDEAILLNERGEVSECTSANIFVAQGGRVWTPPLVSGCLPGVTRAVLLEEISVPGLEIGEKTLYLTDLEHADEAFITSTTRELLPVASVEGLQVRRGGGVSSRLQAALAANLQAYVAPRRRPTAVPR